MRGIARAAKRGLVTVFVALVAACATIGMPTITQLIPEPPVFMVSAPLKYTTRDGHQITVPVGFVTDLASIPRLLWWWQAPHAATMAPAIVHDYLYWEQSCSREEADAIIYLAALDTGMSKANAFAVYQGVDKAGGGPWKNNAAARNKGESRFFNVAYARKLQNGSINPRATLASLQAEAVRAGGMYDPPRSNARLKASCVAALKEFNAMSAL
jgi:hypothetical protein